MKLGHYCAKIGHSRSKHWPKAHLCHPRNSWLSNKDITLNLHTADRNLFNNGHFVYNYEWKCKNNVVSMKSNNLICWTQHHILIESVKRYMTQIKNSLTVPCWHYVWRESRRKALWVNMAALCKKTAVTKLTFIPRIGNFSIVTAWQNKNSKF